MAIILDLRNRLSHAGIPLVHPTSEHVVLANVFGILKNLSPIVAINPWLKLTTTNKLITASKWRFSFWQRQHKPIGSIEGSTEVDLVIESEASKLGIDLGAITEKLLADGITAFTHSLDELLASLKEKRRMLLESQAAHKGGIRSARIA